MGPSGHSRISPGRVGQMQPSLFQSCCQLATVGHGEAGKASHTGGVTEEHLLPLSVERNTSREGSQAQAKVRLWSTAEKTVLLHQQQASCRLTSLLWLKSLFVITILPSSRKRENSFRMEEGNSCNSAFPLWLKHVWIVVSYSTCRKCVLMLLTWLHMRGRATTMYYDFQARKTGKVYSRVRQNDPIIRKNNFALQWMYAESIQTNSDHNGR